MNPLVKTIKRPFFVLYLFIFSLLLPLLQMHLACNQCQSLGVRDTEVNNSDSRIYLQGVYIPRGGETID